MDKWGDGGTYEGMDYDNRPDPYEFPGIRKPIKWEVKNEHRKAGK